MSHKVSFPGRYWDCFARTPIRCTTRTMQRVMICRISASQNSKTALNPPATQTQFNSLTTGTRAQLSLISDETWQSIRLEEQEITRNCPALKYISSVEQS